MAARRSNVPAINARPPAVMIGPPNPIEPGGTGSWPPPYCIEPSGTCHWIAPLSISTALNVPHGGGVHGRSDAAWRLVPTSAATFGIYLQKICLFPERGDLIFARHGTVLASKAKRDAPTEAVGVCCLWDEKANSDS